jgi:hypothetical protein
MCYLTGELIYGQVVDIPLRIIGQGYYKTVEEIAKSAHVRLEPIREDNLTQTHYSDSKKTFSYSHSYVKNFFSIVPYLYELLTFRKNLYSSGKVSAISEKEASTGACETWGKWMTRHGYATSAYGSTNLDAVESGGGKLACVVIYVCTHIRYRSSVIT